MYRHRAIELSFGGTASYGHAERLDDLGRVRADHMTTEHAIGCPIHHELHHDALFAAGERVLHRPETRAIDIDRDAFRAIFSFGGTLESLDPGQVSNVAAAVSNARTFASEVIAKLRQGVTPAEASEFVG